MAVINAAAAHSSSVAIPRRTSDPYPTDTPAADRHAGQPPSFQLLVETTDSISPALLAKHHLPGILLQNGPLAIRYITAHLVGTLPGFAGIPPARQRRLVVGALEGRGGASPGAKGEIGGVDGDVVFEKVGWGRWDAYLQGHPRRTPVEKLQPGLLSPDGYSGESGIFVQSEEEHDEDVDMDGPDAMSLDDDESSEESTSVTDDDMTDEEDWAQMGTAILRQHGGSPISSWANSYTRSPVGWAKRAVTPVEKRVREEQDAVEALVKLGGSF